MSAKFIRVVPDNNILRGHEEWDEDQLKEQLLEWGFSNEDIETLINNVKTNTSVFPYLHGLYNEEDGHEFSACVNEGKVWKDWYGGDIMEAPSINLCENSVPPGLGFKNWFFVLKE